MRNMFVNCFKDFEPLYHFTSFESAVRILASKKIKYGKMNQMNDPCESFRPIYISPNYITGDEVFDSINMVKEELKKYQQISFACDGKNGEGFSLNNMWGYYAEKGYGVCLVFDKRVVLKILASNDYGMVKYQKHYDPSFTFKKIKSKSESKIQMYIRRRTKSIFFIKSKEWEHEQEFRIVTRVEKLENNYLDLQTRWGDAIRCVIFSKAHDVNDEDDVFLSSSFMAISELAHKDCMLLQLAKDLKGNDILYDSHGNTKWGQVLDMWQLDL